MPATAKMTESEKEMMRQAEMAAAALIDTVAEAMGVDEDNAALKAHAAGAQLAILDGLFCIRDGEPWRGINDPVEIARELLRQGGFGE
jgi:hypothetical protein